MTHKIKYNKWKTHWIPAVYPWKLIFETICRAVLALRNPLCILSLMSTINITIYLYIQNTKKNNWYYSFSSIYLTKQFYFNLFNTIKLWWSNLYKNIYKQFKVNMLVGSYFHTYRQYNKMVSSGRDVHSGLSNVHLDGFPAGLALAASHYQPHAAVWVLEFKRIL